MKAVLFSYQPRFLWLFLCCKRTKNLQDCLAQPGKILVHRNGLLQQDAVIACRTDQFDDGKKQKLRFFTVDTILLHRL